MIGIYPGPGEMFVMALAVVLPILLIGLVVWLIVRAAISQSRAPSETAEDVLRRRFASGEIDADEYQRRLEVLRRPG